MTKKVQFLKKVNEAFAKSNIDFIVEHITEDIEWTVIGDFSVKGKKDFTDAMKKMASEQAFQLEIKNIITHGNSAAVDGVMKSPDGKEYAFCDVYKFSGFKNPKIKKMTSYVLELKND
ncbi:MAG: nuclear transport factor 2 family protein [Balneolaceae bacterium]|nr:nuclear transport factor 2 family protein [Balneolaceae bacterium]